MSDQRTSGSAPGRRDICADALETWGNAAQTDKAIEELGELIVALMQHRKGRATDGDVITEIADVGIVSRQLALIFGPEAVEAETERKLERLRLKLKRSNERSRVDTELAREARTACHLELILLDPDQPCGSCGQPAGEHLNYAHRARSIPQARDRHG